jgi:hypothetical protein
MKPPLSETEKLNILLELVREARSQLEADEQPSLRGFLKGRGLSSEQIGELVVQWTGMISDLMKELPADSITLSERQDNLQTGALRILFACLVPDYGTRLQEDIRYSRAPENERRSTISLTPEEIRRILLASLIDGAWSA